MVESNLLEDFLMDTNSSRQKKKPEFDDSDYDDEQEEGVAMLEPLAVKFKEAAKAGGEEVLFFFKENSFFCRHSLPSSSSIVHLKNCSLCVHKHKILNYHHHQRVIQFSWKIKFVMGPLIQQSTGYEKQPHININGVLKIALKASFWLLYLFGAAIYSRILKQPRSRLRDFYLMH